MEKIAFVVVRYGAEINGGAEFHCRMLAERLTKDYQVEVLTTCVKNYVTGGDEYPEGEEMLNGVLIRRFRTNPIDKEKEHSFYKKAKRSRKLRRTLYKLRLLAPLATIFPVWTYRKKYELGFMNSNVFYSSAEFDFIREHANEYKVFIPISLDYPHMYYTTLYAPKKTIVIPTMHNHSISFRSILTEVFTHAAYIGFNTQAEERLAQKIFGPKMSPHGIISVGIQMAQPADWEITQEKYNIPDEYLLYVGRVDSCKTDNLFKYFSLFKKECPNSRLKLVLVGGLFTEQVNQDDIIYTGFVTENEKTTIMQHAKIIVNPSRFESLSLILLEAMSLKKAMLVNGFCNVLYEHCRKSGKAAVPYYGPRSFVKQLKKLDSSEQLRTKMGEKGADYVKAHYDWSLILQKLKDKIESLG